MCRHFIDEENRRQNSDMQCKFQPICPTTNFWVEEKADYIKSVCKTAECNNCLQHQELVREGLTEQSIEWQRRVKHFEDRRKQFPPYGVMTSSKPKKQLVCKQINKCNQKVSKNTFDDCCCGELTIWYQDDCFKFNDITGVQQTGELKFPKQWER